MPRDDAVLLDLIEACTRISRYIAGCTREQFMADDQRQSAVLYQLTLIGEASHRLSEVFRSQHDGLPWVDMRGMRNMIIHEYHRVDLQEVWHTATRDVPVLQRKLEAIRDTRPR